MPGNESQARKIRFGPYELDEAARELRKNGLSIHLQDQPWEILRARISTRFRALATGWAGPRTWSR